MKAITQTNEYILEHEKKEYHMFPRNRKIIYKTVTTTQVAIHSTPSNQRCPSSFIQFLICKSSIKFYQKNLIYIVSFLPSEVTEEAVGFGNFYLIRFLFHLCTVMKSNAPCTVE